MLAETEMALSLFGLVTGLYPQLFSIKTFVDYFYLTGFPRKACFQLLTFDPATREHRMMLQIRSRKAPPRRNLWSLSFYCSLAYHALVALTAPGSAI
jgi:hypothetical protein